MSYCKLTSLWKNSTLKVKREPLEANFQFFSEFQRINFVSSMSPSRHLMQYPWWLTMEPHIFQRKMGTVEIKWQTFAVKWLQLWRDDESEKWCDWPQILIRFPPIQEICSHTYFVCQEENRTPIQPSLPITLPPPVPLPPFPTRPFPLLLQHVTLNYRGPKEGRFPWDTGSVAFTLALKSWHRGTPILKASTNSITSSSTPSLLMQKLVMKQHWYVCLYRHYFHSEFGC